MLGKMIDEKLIERRISRTEFARRINRSRSYVYGILDRETVETADLLVISKVLKYNFFAHLHDKVKHLPPFQESSIPKTENKSPIEEKLSFLEKENTNLKRIVELLEEKVESKR